MPSLSYIFIWPSPADTRSPSKTAYVLGGKYMFVNLLGAVVCIACTLLIKPMVTKDVACEKVCRVGIMASLV
jgi:hypothetical protein